jgi:hypothetical protein
MMEKIVQFEYQDIQLSTNSYLCIKLIVLL